MYSTVMRRTLSFVYDKLDDDLRASIECVGECCDNLKEYIEFIENQIHPDNATETGSLEDFERLYKCIPESGDTVQVRRNRVIAAIRLKGGMSREFFEVVAEGLGYEIATSGSKYLQFFEGEFAPFRAGISRAGDRVYELTGDYTRYTVVVRGTNVENDTDLQRYFGILCTTGVNFIYENS